MTMYFSHMSHINVGIITTLWSVQPLFCAILDYFLNGEKIRIYHIFGIVFIVCSGVCISLSGIPSETHYGYYYSNHVLYDHEYPKWIAVMFGILTPLWMIANSLFVKHLT